MKTTLLKVVHDGVTYTRRTHRTYTHVVLARWDYDAQIARVRAEKIVGSRRSYEFLKTQGEALPPFEEWSPAEVERHVASINARRPATPKFNDSWCGRPDLAQKTAAKLTAEGWIDVVIVPVQPKEVSHG